MLCFAKEIIKVGRPYINVYYPYMSKMVKFSIYFVASTKLSINFIIPINQCKNIDYFLISVEILWNDIHYQVFPAWSLLNCFILIFTELFNCLYNYL